MCRIKFSTIGTGKITEKMINGGKLCDDFSLYGVYSRTEKRAMEFQEKFNIPNRFTDLGALAESDTDAVYIASPTALHFERCVFRGNAPCFFAGLCVDSRKFTQNR